jgi:hypothetical protein
MIRWSEVAAQLAAEPQGTLLRVVRHMAENPRDAGLAPALAPPAGQRADFRLGRLYVQDFGSHYDAFLAGEAPAAELPAGAAGGALLGLALARTREAALVGALLAWGACLVRRS